VGSQRHVLAALNPGNSPGTHRTGGWVGPRAGLDGRKISSTPGFDPRTVQPVASHYTDWTIPVHKHVQGAAERTPLFEKRINSKPKKYGKCFSISGKNTECRFTSTYFEQNITQVAALNIDTLM